MEKVEYPYQNTNIESLKGERWKPIPGFDDLYEVSNLGRVKSLGRWLPVHFNDTQYWRPAKILRQTEHKSFNKNVKENTYVIQVALKCNGLRFNTSTSRYVYYAFVKKFDMENKKNLISMIDNNGRNLHYQNLLLTDARYLLARSEKVKRRSPFAERQVVKQYTLDGKLLVTYESLTNAALKTGYKIAGIYACINKLIYQHKGFIWVSMDKEVAEKTVPKKSIFHKHLWATLGKPKMDKKNPMPVLNLSIDSLPNEKWKPIEWLDKRYQVSNLGRVQTIPHMSKGNHMWVKGIIKQFKTDQRLGIKPKCLNCTFTKDEKFVQIKVARLVYYHFVKKFDLADKTITIQYKDGCFFNLDAKNLMLKKKA
jgi:NUMOD4 motif